MKNIKWQLIFDKVGTVVVDRRFWLALFTVISIVLGTPELADRADSLSAEAVDWVELIAPIAALLLTFVGITVSWTKRAPSGLGYKDTTIDLDIEDVLKALEKLSHRDK